jgi:hypothetical protein
MEHTFEKLFQLAIGKPNENFINAEEVDFEGLRDSSYDKFL